MQTHTQLHFDVILSEIHSAGHYNNTAVESTSSKYFLPEGSVRVQTLSNYFASVELFDSCLSEKMLINFSVTEPSFFMLANPKDATCFLCYRPAGEYRTYVPVGTTTLLLITFKPDWFSNKCSRLPELKCLLSAFQQNEAKQISLDKVGIGQSVFKAFEASCTITSDLDHDGYDFVNGCINKYYNKIKGRRGTMEHYQTKATSITAFVMENYKTDMVENMPKLAEIFGVSQRSMARMSLVAFGRPLHEQVIKLRIEYAVDLLQQTDKPIKEIALLCGYKDAHYFSKAFKNYVGKCPKDLQRKRLPEHLDADQNRFIHKQLCDYHFA